MQQKLWTEPGSRRSPGGVFLVAEVADGSSPTVVESRKRLARVDPAKNFGRGYFIPNNSHEKYQKHIGKPPNTNFLVVFVRI